MHRCQCKIWRRNETGPDTVEQHELDYIVKSVGAEDYNNPLADLIYEGFNGRKKAERTVDNETEDGNTEKTLDAPD